MTVNDLVGNFRAGLLGLLPSVERIGLPWKRNEAYDEWDDLASAVYKALVVEPLRSGLNASEQDRFGLPDYDMLLPTYAGISMIEVLPAEADERLKVFHALGTTAVPFDTVEFRAIRPDGMPISDELETAPFEATCFALRVFTGQSLSGAIERVKVV